MKKAICLMLACMVCAALLCACGGQGASSGAAASSAGAASSAAQSGLAIGDIKVGVIHIDDPATGVGYSYAHDMGIQEMQQKTRLEDYQIIRKINIPDDAAAAEEAMRACIQEGSTIIFATSQGYADASAKLASEFPDIYFFQCAGTQTNPTNLSSYFGRAYQARYLAGIAAAMRSESGLLGYVAAYGPDNAEVTSGLNAFAMGAHSVNTDCEVQVSVTNSWDDEQLETQAAQLLIENGCDVIAQHTNTAAPQAAAQAAGVWGIGYNSDMIATAPSAVITSVIWNWGLYYTQSVKSILDGTFATSAYDGDLESGLVGLAPLNAGVAADGTMDALEGPQAAISDGSFAIFEGVIPTNEEGVTVGQAGVALSDADIADMHWYYQNVVLL